MAGTGPKQFQNQRVSAEKISSGIAALHVVQLDSTGGIISGGVGGGSTQVSVREILTSSGVSVMDSTNNAIGVTIRAGSAAGTEYTDGDVDATVSGQAILFDNSSNTLRPVTIARGLPVNVVAGSAASTTVQVSSLGGVVLNRIIDRDQTSNVAAVLNADPASTVYAIAVRQVGAVANSTVVTVSTGSVRVHQSSAADLNVTVAGYSTTVNVSSLAGAVIVRSSKADALVSVYQSTASELLMEPRLSSANTNSSNYLPVRLTDGTNFTAPSTTVAVSTGSVRVHQSTATDLLARVNQGVGNSSGADRWRVSNANSSAADYNPVRLVDSSGTGYHGPTNPLPVSVTDSSNAVVKSGDSVNNAIRVNVVAGAAGGSTLYTVNGISVSTSVQNSSGYLPVRLTNSTAFLEPGLEYTDGSTTSTLAAPGLSFNNSSANTMRMVGSSTPLPTHIRTSSGADMSDSTNNALRVNVVAGAAGGSTIVTVSTVQGVVAVVAASSGATAFFPVRVSDGSTFLQPQIQYTDGSTTSTLVGFALAFNNSSAQTMRLAGSSTPLPVHLRTSSGADMGDSTNNALRVNVVAGSAAGSTEATVRQSTYTDLNTLSRVADRDNSTKVAAVLSETQPASSAYGLVVRIPAPITDSTNNAFRVNVVAGAAGGSTEVTVRQSTYTDFNTLSRIADRDQSTQVAAVLNDTPASTVWALAVRQVGATPTSTTVNVSSLAGKVTVEALSSGATAFFPVRVSDGSTFLQPSIEYTDGSTVSTKVGPGLVYNNSSNDTMRLVGITQPLPVQLRTGINTFASTTVVINSSAATAVYTLVSSVANTKICCYAYSITSTAVTPMAVEFMSSGTAGGGGSTGNIWGLDVGSASSGVTGANIALPAPSRIFATASGEALGMRLGSTGVNVRVSIATFNE